MIRLQSIWILPNKVPNHNTFMKSLLEYFIMLAMSKACAASASGNFQPEEVRAAISDLVGLEK